VRRHHLIHKGGERFDLAYGLEFGDGRLDVIEQMVKHRVFGAQDVGDFHGSGKANCLPCK
jgi:hypothetical protein